MKIVHLSHSEISTDSRILKMLTVCKDLNYEYLALNPSVSKNVKSYFRKIGIINFKYLYFFWVYLKITLISLVKLYKFNPNVIHCHDWYMLPISVIGKILFKSKLVYDAHELESERQQMSELMKKIVKYIERISWKHVDYFITVSDLIQKWYLESYGYKNSKVIINSPEIMSINSAATSAKNFNLRDIFNLKSEILIYIYNGYLTHGRGIEIMLEAFSKTETSSVLVFLGEGPLIEKINTYKEQNENIFVHKMVPHDEVTQIVSSADFGLCLIEDASLSYRYSLPNKLFEYIFAGLPVVASNLPAIKKIVLDFNLGVVINLSVENLIKVLTENSLLTEVSKFTYKNSISHLSWESQALKLREIYSLMSKLYEA
jgi:glycosyltransferase involved in cell wall biosynthesis